MSHVAVPDPMDRNEYFVPGDGLDREVITAELYRYLENDALVRVGSYRDVGYFNVYYILNARLMTSPSRKQAAKTSKDTTSQHSEP